MEVMERKLRYSNTLTFKLYHLCYYFSRAEGYDADRQMVLDFKNEDEEAIRHFILEALAFFGHGHVDEDLIILRPMRSKETKYDHLNESPLDRLGDSIATVFHVTYYPSLLTKSRPTKQVKTLSPSMRKAELQGVYQIEKNYFDYNTRPVLIIDDVVTTGATVCAIIGTILKDFPKTKINVFSLAWTPTPDQQLYIQQQQINISSLNEPEAPYGTKSSNTVDEDFENGNWRFRSN
jgi:predicted amidophosphoribosyltransferase